MPVAPYPLTLTPRFVPKPWGTEALARLAERAGAAFEPGTRVGECWELADHPARPLPIAHGPLRGQTLHEAIARWSAEAVVGPGVSLTPDGRFPLTIKRLATSAPLSIQVHPPDRPGTWGKTEAWYVVRAEPEARLALGLLESHDREALAERFVNATPADAEALDALLAWHPAVAGQAWLNRAGVIHALGAGLDVLEVQQATDATYRLFDWGRGREQHVRAALAVARLTAGLPDEPVPAAVGLAPGRTALLACEHFRLQRLDLEAHAVLPLLAGARPTFVIVSALMHALDLFGDAPGAGWRLRLAPESSALVPAACAPGAAVSAVAEPMPASSPAHAGALALVTLPSV